MKIVSMINSTTHPNVSGKCNTLGGSTGKALGISQTFNSMLLASSINLEKDAPFLHNVTFKGPSGTAQVSESIWGEGVYRRRRYPPGRYHGE